MGGAKRHPRSVYFIGTARRWRAGKKVAASFDKEDIKVVSHGDTAIASYRFVIRIQSDGVDIDRRYRRTNVWLKRQDRSQIIGGQMSSLDPQGAR